MSKCRNCIANITYTRNGKISSEDDKKKTAAEIRKYLLSFSFTGNATGEADNIEIKLENSSMKWFKTWLPRTKDKITAKIKPTEFVGSKEINCGTFLIDSLSLSGNDLLCEISATSIPEASSFRSTARNKTWNKATLKTIGKTIANKYKMTFVFDGTDVNVGKVEQNGQTDCEFLASLCNDYAYGFKMFNGKIIIYEKAKYETKKTVGTIKRTQVDEWNWETNLVGTYTGAKMTYTNDDDKDVSVRVGKGNRWLAVEGDAQSIAQAKTKALAQLNTKNETTTTMNITLPGSTKYSETDTVKIIGFERGNGKYFIDKVEHSVSGDGGFTTTLTMHKVQKRVIA